MENYNPFEGIAQIKAWVDESFLKIAPPDDVKERYRDIGKAIDQLNKLGFPVPEALSAEKEDLKKILNVPNEHKRQLTALARELSSLAKDINRRLRRGPTTGTKGPRKKLEVMFPDGTVICENLAIDTFVKSLQHIGLGRVAELQSIRCSGYPLVSDRENGSRDRGVRQIDGYFIGTISSTAQKQAYLQRIADALRIDIVVEIGDK